MQLLKGGKYPLQTKWLPVYKTQMFWTSLWNATQNFWCFPEQCPAWDQDDFLRALSSKNEATLRLYIWNCWPVFQISTSLFKHLMFRDAVPTAAPFQWWAARCPCLTGSHVPVTSFFSISRHCALWKQCSTEKHQIHVRVRMGKSNSNFKCRKRDEMVPFLNKKRGMILIREISWVVVQVAPGED